LGRRERGERKEKSAREEPGPPTVCSSEGRETGKIEKKEGEYTEKGFIQYQEKREVDNGGHMKFSSEVTSASRGNRS